MSRCCRIAVLPFLLRVLCRFGDAAPIFFNTDAGFRNAVATSHVVLNTESFENEPHFYQPLITTTEISIRLNIPGNTRINNEISRFATDGTCYLESETLRGSSAPYELTFSFASPINAFAIDIVDLGTALNVGKPDPKSVILQTVLGSQTVLDHHVGANYNVVTVGVVDLDTVFSLVTLKIPDCGRPQDFFSYDRLQFGAVPEPRPFLMLLFAALAVWNESNRHYHVGTHRHT